MAEVSFTKAMSKPKRHWSVSLRKKMVFAQREEQMQRLLECEYFLQDLKLTPRVLHRGKPSQDVLQYKMGVCGEKESFS